MDYKEINDQSILTIHREYALEDFNCLEKRTECFGIKISFHSHESIALSSKFLYQAECVAMRDSVKDVAMSKGWNRNPESLTRLRRKGEKGADQRR